MYVVDCADERRLEEAAQVLSELLLEEKLQNIPILVFANKKDLDFALPAGEVSKIMVILFLLLTILYIVD